MNIVIPMAGLGSRFQNAGVLTPKPLIVVNGKTLIEHSVDSLGIDGRYIFITRVYDDPQDNETLTSILKTLRPDSVEIRIDKMQYGAADACLYAKDYINNDDELIITNCDQLLSWDPEHFLSAVRDSDYDGGVVLFKSKNDKNSFAEVSSNRVIRLAEKDPISDNALVGVHHWKYGHEFISSAERLLKEYKNFGLKECYVSNTYNYLINEGKNILPYKIENNMFIPLGTPEDVEVYLAKVKEFYTEKPKTIFCDIDGTIIKHAHRFSHIGKEDPQELDGVIAKFNEWDSKGHKIVLTTARKESARYITEKHLSDLGFCWDYLLMGMTSGTRFLLNDKLTESDPNRAVAINLITDKGFSQISWDEHGL
jgi:NDP-sugar pyrophosphorylase family protein